MTTTMNAIPVEVKGLAELVAGSLGEQRSKAMERLAHLPFPSHKDEAWRRTDPELVRPAGEAVLKPRSTYSTLGGIEVPSGVTFGTMEQHAANAKLFSVNSLERANMFGALNAAAFQGGTVMTVGKDVSTGDGALLVEHHYPSGVGSMAAPRTYLEVGAFSNVTLVEYFTADEGELLAIPSVEVHVGEGAKFRYIFVNTWNNQARVVPQIHATVEKDAHFQLMFAGFGTKLTKAFFESDLVGEGCKSEVLGMVLGQGRQHYDVDAQQNHRVGSTVSDVLCHVALTDRARSVFAGNILCVPGAQKIDGYQQNRNLLLSDKARADSMPRLEIEANDVRCTHGASFTTYDPGQRFYLQSRGLDKFEAEHMLVSGFFASVSERMDHEVVSEWLADKVEAKMASVLGK